MMKKTIAFAALLALTGSGCQMATSPVINPPTVTSTTSGTEKTPLEGVWRMTKFQQGKAVAQDVSKNDWRLTIEGGRLGFKICNVGGGDFTLKDNVVKGDKVVSTLMFCEGLSSTVEGLVMTGLNNGLVSNIDGDTLTLSEASMKQVYTFERVQMAMVTGSVSYRERIALPASAVINVQIQDVSKADAAAVVLGEQTIEANGKNVPFNFSVPYETKAANEKATITIRATIKDGDKLLFTTTEQVRVITPGNPTKDINLVLQKTN